MTSLASAIKSTEANLEKMRKVFQVFPEAEIVNSVNGVTYRVASLKDHCPIINIELNLEGDSYPRRIVARCSLYHLIDDIKVYDKDLSSILLVTIHPREHQVYWNNVDKKMLNKGYSQSVVRDFYTQVIMLLAEKKIDLDPQTIKGLPKTTRNKLLFA